LAPRPFLSGPARQKIFRLIFPPFFSRPVFPPLSFFFCAPRGPAPLPLFEKSRFIPASPGWGTLGCRFGSGPAFGPFERSPGSFFCCAGVAAPFFGKMTGWGVFGVSHGPPPHRPPKKKKPPFFFFFFCLPVDFFFVPGSGTRGGVCPSQLRGGGHSKHGEYALGGGSHPPGKKAGTPWPLGFCPAQVPPPPPPPHPPPPPPPPFRKPAPES